jgi:hypothetical protein
LWSLRRKSESTGMLRRHLSLMGSSFASFAFTLGLLPPVIATGASQLARRHIATPPCLGKDRCAIRRHFRHSCAHRHGCARAIAAVRPHAQAQGRRGHSQPINWSRRVRDLIAKYFLLAGLAHARNALRSGKELCSTLRRVAHLQARDAQSSVDTAELHGCGAMDN